MRRILILCLLFVVGCVTQTSLDGFALGADARRPGAVFFVQHQPKDERHLDAAIANALRDRGLNVDAVAADAADFKVSYVDRWYWDMRMYLIDLRIDVRDAETGVLVATGRSYQTSLSAMGQSHEDIIAKVADLIVYGAAGKARSPQRKGNDRRKR